MLDVLIPSATTETDWGTHSNTHLWRVDFGAIVKCGLQFFSHISAVFVFEVVSFIELSFSKTSVARLKENTPRRREPPMCNVGFRLEGHCCDR